MHKDDLLYDLVRLARPLAQQAEAAVAEMLSHTSVTVRMRTVLEALERIGPATVPSVARELEIQRQYVQVMMNEVEVAGLVTRQSNPAHKRSALFALTEAGAQIVAGIRKAELQVIGRIARDFTMDEVERAHHVVDHCTRQLRKLNAELAD